MNATQTHRLVLPADANHHGTLYAGALLRLALEAAYATAHRHVGPSANLVLRRVLEVECYYPAPVGSVVEIVGSAIFQTQAYLVVGLVGSPLVGKSGPWMDAMMGFVQIDEHGRPTGFPEDCLNIDPPHAESWTALAARLAERQKHGSPSGGRRRSTHKG
jgi:acyl-CoA hydrolase